MSDNIDKKTEAEFEEAYQKFLAARKAKKKKFPGWLILAIAIAALLVIIVMLIKPWSLFDKGEGESVNIYETEADMQQQEMMTAEQPMDQGPMPADAAEPAPAEIPSDIPVEIPAETPAPEAPPAETAAPETVAETQAPTAAPETTATSEEQNASAVATMIAAGRPVQDNAGLFSQADSDHINALVETGDMAFAGIDYFVIANSGSEGMSNDQYAQNYYKQLVKNKMATGNGIVVFINTADMTVNIVTMGTTNKSLGSAGRKTLTEDFIEVFKSTGSYVDAATSTYNVAHDLIMEQLENETETSGDTSDSWIEID